MFPGLYVPRALCSQGCMFPGLYVPRVLWSQGPMVPGSYGPLTKDPGNKDMLPKGNPGLILTVTYVFLMQAYSTK